MDRRSKLSHQTTRVPLSLLHTRLSRLFSFPSRNPSRPVRSLFNLVSTQNIDRRNFSFFFFDSGNFRLKWPAVKENRSVARAPLARMRGGHRSLTAQRRACRCVRALFAMTMISMPRDRPVACLEARDARGDDQVTRRCLATGCARVGAVRRKTVVATLSRATCKSFGRSRASKRGTASLLIDGMHR